MMHGPYYPIAVTLRNRRVIVVGGGKVAERKIKTLLGFGARIRVVSSELTRSLRSLADRRRIRWLNRRVRASDVSGGDIVIAATSDAAVNKEIKKWGKKRKALVNIVDCARLSDFISPAIFRLSKTTVAVYTQGKDPALSRDLKNFLKENWDVFLSYRRRLQKDSA